ncbi:hypothetical protein BT69DRAFT_1321764 [Atractiella rhizophila]|nr:hypothetical protein BT69DRAFT_1321764 [Atractiella rhizophila]
MHSRMGDGDLIWAATMFQVPPSHSLHPDHHSTFSAKLQTPPSVAKLQAGQTTRALVEAEDTKPKKGGKVGEAVRKVKQKSYQLVSWIPTGYNNDDSIDKAEEMYRLFEWWRLRFHYADADLKNNHNARPDEVMSALTEPFLSPAFSTIVQRMIFDSPAWVYTVRDSVDFDESYLHQHWLWLELQWHKERGQSKKSSGKADKQAIRRYSERCAINRAACGQTSLSPVISLAGPSVTPVDVDAAAKDADNLAGCLGLSSASRSPPSFIDPSLLNETITLDHPAAFFGADKAEGAQEHEGDSDMLDYGTVGTGQSWPKDVFAADRMQGMEIDEAEQQHDDGWGF